MKLRKRKKIILQADVADTAAGEVAAQFKPVTQEFVRAQTDSSSFSKGNSYFRNGYILDPVLRGDKLRATSMGQSGGPYTVEATLVPADKRKAAPIADYACGCPRGGFCKHVVALLLTWIHTPEEVEVRSDVLAQLGERSREELLEIIAGLLKKEPELDGWIEQMLIVPAKDLAPGSAARLTISPSKVRRQVAAAFAHRTYEWGEDSAIAGELSELTESADRWTAMPMPGTGPTHRRFTVR